MSEYSIQELSDQTGLPRRTIHFYVQQGLLPPPVGAGVGTRYFENHLFCLRLIPLLKRKGLKLDEIRARLKDLDESDLRALYDQINEPAPPAPAFLPTSQPFAHYQLPAGMTLTVPATLTASERKKLAELLHTIGDIFSE
ncbi:MAG: MerR family transcriptional regulator [Chloroflexi bacterium]|nr:MerR family transcriptional regulator [Chloroflexota bacterium]